MPALEIRLLGGLRIDSEGRPTTELVSSRGSSLLAYLLLHRGATQPRRRLAFLFWPDSTEAQAQTNLRRELHQLRKSLPEVEPFLKADARTLSWGTEVDCRLDVERFEEGIEKAAKAADPSERVQFLTDALDSYQGDLLPDIYEDWVEVERERLRSLLTSVLDELVAELEAERRYPEALVYARRRQQHDPLEESSYRTLMRLHALNGDTAAALAAYRQCASILMDQLDVSPGQATETLFRQLSTIPTDIPVAVREGAREPLVGRVKEWQQLLTEWQQASGDGARLVVAQGEAGVGKTRLGEELLDWVASQGFSTARAHCYRAEGRLAFAPVAEWFRSPAIGGALAQLDIAWLSEVARVLPELLPKASHTEGAAVLHESWQRRRLFEALSRAAITSPQPLLLLLDDAQWCDRETLEWLHHLLRFDPESRLLVILTVRSEERTDNPALETLLLELGKSGRTSEINLGPLDLRSSAELAGRVVGRRLEQDEANALFEESEGHPLFVVELARAGLTTSQWQSEAADTNPEVLPPKVQAVITARLAALSPAARSLAQLAATVGRNFSFDQLRSASELDEPALVDALDELWRRKIVREHVGGSFDFSHDRIREVAYGELGPAQRRFLHRRLAQVLELMHSDDIDNASSQIAGHYEQAGQVARAIHFYERAARVARRVAASREAVRLLRRGLDLLQRLPLSHERDRLELSLQYALSAPLNISLGFASPELEASLERVRLLGERLQQPKALIGSLVGLFGVHFVKGNSRKARQMGENAVALASREPELLAESHFALGGALFSLGHFTAADENFRKSEEIEGRSGSATLVFGSDLAVFRHSYRAHTLWHLGDTEQANLLAERAISLAQGLEDPYSLALATAYAALTQQFLGNRKSALAHADTVKDLCDRYGYAYYGNWGGMVRGWALAQAGDVLTGAAEIEAALEALSSAGALARQPYYLSLHASVLVAGNRHADALEVLHRALEHSGGCAEAWWDSELIRLRGELELNSGGGAGKAEDSFREALGIATEQGSRSLELRAVTSLAELLQQQGRSEEARTALAGTVSHLPPAHESEALRRANSLLLTID